MICLNNRKNKPRIKQSHFASDYFLFSSMVNRKHPSELIYFVSLFSLLVIINSPLLQQE
jgi:hypothetical protein